MYAEAYADSYYGTGMGLPIPAIGSAISAIGSLFGGNSKDPGRLAKNQQWYSECSSGNADACCALQHMTGRFGLAKCGVYGDASGWATSKAKDDAFRLYNALPAQSQAYATPASVASPTTTSNYPITTQSGSMVPSAAQTVAALGTNPIMLAGLAAVAYMVATGGGNKRRRR